MLHFLAYLKFTGDNLRFLSFGFTMCFFSSVGQTYFIGVFGPSVRAEFGLTHTSWGGVYMAGTLMSALVLPWTGAKIDTIPLPRYSVMVLLGLVVAAAAMALTPSVTFLVLSVFLLRQTGQGLVSMTGSTAMARYFPADRGKAVSLAALGYSVGETLLPVLMVLCIAAIGWRYSFAAAAIATAVLAIPFSLFLLRGHGERDGQFAAEHRESAESGPGSWTRRDVLKDYRFFLLLPAALAPSFIATALFFHHLSFAEMKGWDATWFTGSYWVYAVGSIVAMLAAGPLIDRFSAVRILPMFLMPLALGLALVWAFDEFWWAWAYFVLLGITSGVTYTGLVALWAEIYGTRHLGAIKSLFTSISVFASALGPVTMGAMMDQNVSIENICLIFAAYCIAATGIFVMGLKEYRTW